MNGLDKLSNEILSTISITSHKGKMNQMINNYRFLYEFGKIEQVKAYSSMCICPQMPIGFLAPGGRVRWGIR